MACIFEVFVPGIPATAGSKKGFPIRRKNGMRGVSIVADCERSKPWMAIVSHAVSQVIDSPVVGEPLKLKLVFVLARPKGHFGKKGLRKSAPRAPITKPDLTKLIRCTEDALKGIVWNDDSQVVEQETGKVYGTTPGVLIRVERVV